MAERVGLCFDHLALHKNVKLSPQPIHAKMVDGKVVVTFDQPLREGEQATFEIAGADHKFINVKAIAKDNQVSLESSVSNPEKVRYAWKDNPVHAHLVSEKGLPSPPFELSVNP